MLMWAVSEVLMAFKTGLPRTERSFVWRLVRGDLIQHYEKRHAQREAPLSPFASLLLTLYWMRHYPSSRCMGAEFGAAHSSIDEALQHTVEALFSCLVPAVSIESAGLHHVYRAGVLDGVRLIVDSTFLILPRPDDKDERKRFYHMKSPTRAALKWQLVTTTTGEPWHISHVVRGAHADITLLRDTKLLDRLPHDTRVLGDKGYLGEDQVLTPAKKPRGGEVEEKDMANNKKINSKRVVVENCFHEFKKWAILGGEYRGDFRSEAGLQHATHMVHVVGALVKRHLIAHPLRADPAAIA